MNFPFVLELNSYYFFAIEGVDFKEQEYIGVEYRPRAISTMGIIEKKITIDVHRKYYGKIHTSMSYVPENILKAVQEYINNPFFDIDFKKAKANFRNNSH